MATYYVDRILGSDLNSGLSSDSPLKTLNMIVGNSYYVKENGIYKLATSLNRDLYAIQQPAVGNPYTVVCYYYGEWATPGQPYNPKPWSWINNRSPERLPLRAGKLEYYPYKADYSQTSWQNVASSGNATLTYTANSLRLAATGIDPIFYPNFSSFSGQSYYKIQIKFNRLAGAAWDGSVFYTTAGHSWSGSYRMSFPEPTYSNGVGTSIIDMSNIIGGGASNDWITNTITGVRIDFGASVSDVFDLFSIEILDANLNPITEVYSGMDSRSTQNFEWEMNLAYDYGIDVFSVDAYWDGSKNFNDYILKKFAKCSTRSPKFSIMWALDTTTQPVSGPFGVSNGTPNLTAWYSLMDYFHDNFFVCSNYWKIGGKPVLTIAGDAGFISSAYKNYNSGASPAGPTDGVPFCNSLLTALNAYVSSKPGSAAPSGIHFNISGMGAAASHPYWFGDAYGWTGGYRAAGFSSVTQYNQFNCNYNQIQTAGGGSATLFDETAYQTITGKNPYTYEYLREVYRRALQYAVTSSTQIPYFAPVICGWEVTPWVPYGVADTPNNHRKPSIDQFYNHLIDTKTLLDSGPLAATNKVIMIYAWNEYGEGGYICPTMEYKFQMLQAISTVFSKSSINYSRAARTIKNDRTVL